MSVLYIETDTHLQRDIEWTWYTDDKGKVEIWENYLDNYSNLTLIAPYKKELCTKGSKDLIKLGNKYDLEKKHITLEYIDDLYENKLRMLSRTLQEYIKYLIAREIRRNEYKLIIIGQDNNVYQKQAIKYAKKYNREYEINGINLIRQ